MRSRGLQHTRCYLDGYAAKAILRGQGYIPGTDPGLAQVRAFCHR